MVAEYIFNTKFIIFDTKFIIFDTKQELAKVVDRSATIPHFALQMMNSAFIYILCGFCIKNDELSIKHDERLIASRSAAT